MTKFIKYYALEIYTVISMLILVIAGILGDLSVIQKFVLVYIFLFILHEWEEGKYPGGFIEMISSMIEIDVSEEQKKASRIPTGILLLLFTIVPFCFDNYVIPILVTAFLGIFEGFVHIFGIKLFHRKVPYTPGLLTAELELITSIVLFVYLTKNHLATGSDYLFGVLIMVSCFMIMQKTLTMSIGMKYSDLPKKLKKQLAKKN